MLTRPIVAEFLTVQMKQNAVSAVRDYNKNKPAVKYKLNIDHLSIAGKRQAIYVANHQLITIASTKKLFFQSREFPKNNGYQYCWTTNDNVFIRKVDRDNLMLVN